MVVYAACLLSGVVVVPLRAWLPAHTLQAMIQDSGACLALVQGKGQSQIIAEAMNRCPGAQALEKFKKIFLQPEAPGNVG